jgi:hypothetical protein
MKIPAFLLGLPRWGRRLIAAAVALLALYAILGFLVLPALVKAKLPPRVAQALGREVTLRKVRTNPFALSITLEGFQILDKDREPFLAWDRLYVNLGASTLFGGAISLDDVELVRPYGRVVVEKGGRLNFSDILERLGKAEPEAKPKAEEKPREIAIDHLAIHGARVQLLDRSLSEPFATTVGPVTLELRGFRTARDSRNPYTFSGRTESGETFAWTGVFSTEPLRSQGKVSLERLVLPKYHPYYKDQVAFDLKDGLASLQAGYTFQWSEGVHIIRLQEGSLDLLNLKLAEAGKAENAIDLPRLEVRGVQADLVARTAEVGSLLAWDGKLDVARLPNGEISLVKLLTPKPRPKPPESEKPFALRLKEVGSRNFTVAFQDQATVRPVRLQIEKLDVTLQDFCLDPKASARLTASALLDGRTPIQVEGTVAPLKPGLDLTLKVDDLELPPLDPYLEPALDVRVNRGRFSLSGRLRGTFEGRPSDAIAFKGNIRLEHFEAMDGAQQEPFLRYRSLRLDGLDVCTNPRTLSIQGVQLTEPEHRMVIAPDGTTNVARALKTQPAPPRSPAGTALGSALPATPADAFKVAIAKVHMQGGRLTFIDRSLEPNAAFLITDLEGTNTGLSTEAAASSSLDLKGKAGGLAPLSIQGHSMPLRHDQDTDVALRIQGADLSDFSPYTGKYLGYTVRKGKLDVDARVRIQQRKLNAQFNTKLDQFYFGDRTNSPEATHLPVKLALALLRDRKGVIDLELPVEGSLDDPDFHYGGIVWKALLNVIGKIVTSPFTLIGSLFGGGEQDLSFVAFQPGAVGPDEAARKKIEVLAKSLQERPDLSLEVEGTADPATDGAALKKLALERLICATKAKSLAAKNPDLDPEAVVVAPEERAHWLAEAFEAAFPSPKETSGKTKSPAPPAGEMEQRLLGTLTVNPNQLRELADRRTKALVKLLLEGGKVESSRVFEVEGGERAQKEGGSRVYFSLK